MLRLLVRAMRALALVHEDTDRPSRDVAERWEQAAAAAGFGTFEWNRVRDEVTLDAQAAALCGCRIASGSLTLPRSELRGYVHEDDRARMRAGVEGAIADGRRFTARCRMRCRDGEMRHLQVVGRLVRGEPARIVGLVRDVSGEELHGQLAMQRDSALAVAKARMDFVSRLSHELRTPLNAVVGFAELMSLDASHPLPPPQAQRLKYVVDASVQLRTLVDEMLDLSKIDAGAIPVSVRLVDAATVLRSAAALVEPAARQSGVQIVNHADPETPLRVYADPQRLQQVFVNLLSNGCKYNRRGGEVVLSSEWNERGLVVRFADTGVGIAAQDLAELGRPFRRVGPQASQVAGTGLGLYIVKLILDRMGATLEVKSDPGLGSCFAVTLPIKPPAGA